MTVFEQLRAERLAWREKYLAATPAEQERMLAEKAAKREEEERLRKQRIYDERKNRFTEKANNQIFLYGKLLIARKVALEEIKNFNGKVCNNRLTKNIDAKLKEIDKNFYASLTVCYDHSAKGNIGKLKIAYYNHFSYGLYNDVTLKIRLTDVFDGNRVDWSLTESEESNAEKFLTDMISSWKNAIKNYGKAYKALKKVEKAIEDYAKENFYLRDFFKTEHVLSNGYYL